MAEMRAHWQLCSARRWLPATCCVVALAAMFFASPVAARAEDYSPPPILQWFETNYATQEQRSADMFLAGYGATWIPPTGQADFNDDYSVGYDVYNRFDLGTPGNRTLYGTETGLKQLATVLHRFDGRLHVDAVLNHNGYSDDDYYDRNNPSSQYYLFRQAGGYPGFVLENPDGGTDPAGVPGTFGDFHDPVWGKRLSQRAVVRFARYWPSRPIG